jgi:regulator of protease activity HflC (stomatin/prohibitin superfamily)
VNPREYQVNILEIGVNQVSLLGRQGAAVFTKTQLTSQNSAVQALEQNMLKAQQALREDYYEEREGLFKGRSRGFAESKIATKDFVDKKPKKHQQTPENVVPGFVLSQFVSFPSRDGFDISLDMTVEFELLPENIAWIYKTYGDLPAAVEKIIMPTILSVSRLKGSAYGARDFIVGEGREKFQKDLTEALAHTLADKKILVYSALIRHVSVPMQILDPIQQASIANEQDLTNKEKQNTARKMAELNTEMSLIEQRREQVAQETRKLKAEIKADQHKNVAEIQATTTKLVAEIAKQTAAVHAEKVKRLGKADADAYQMVEGENAKGFQLKVEAFGDPEAYNLWHFAEALPVNMDIRFLHAGEGTFWTDLERTAGFSDHTTGALLQRQKEKSPQ